MKCITKMVLAVGLMTVVIGSAIGNQRHTDERGATVSLRVLYAAKDHMHRYAVSTIDAKRGVLLVTIGGTHEQLCQEKGLHIEEADEKKAATMLFRGLVDGGVAEDYAIYKAGLALGFERRSGHYSE